MQVLVLVMVLEGQDRKCCSTEDRQAPRTQRWLFPTEHAHFLEVSLVPQLAQSFRECALSRPWAVGHLSGWSGPGFRVWVSRHLRVRVSGMFISASPNLVLGKPNWMAECRELRFRRQA